MLSYAAGLPIWSLKGTCGVAAACPAYLNKARIAAATKSERDEHDADTAYITNMRAGTVSR